MVDGVIETKSFCELEAGESLPCVFAMSRKHSLSFLPYHSPQNKNCIWKNRLSLGKLLDKKLF